MIKIVNGKIVREGVVGNASSVTSSPVLPSPRRRCSIQDLQLKEYEQQVLQTTPPTIPEVESNSAPSWSDIFKQEIVVFGLHVNLITLCILSITCLFVGGFTGLLVSLVAIYLGTLFKPRAKPTCVTDFKAQEKTELGGIFAGDGNKLGKSANQRSSPIASM